MSASIDITTASVPNDYCPASLQEAWPYLVALLSAELAGNNNLFNDGDTTPSPDDQNKPWVPSLFSGGNPPAFVYRYVNGAWIMPNPTPTGAVMMYEGTEASIDTYDGGEAGTITETTGPMWQKVSGLNARIPIGPGTLESGRVIAVGGTLGSEKVELEEENIPLHEIVTYTENAGANLTPVGIIADDDRSATPNSPPVDSFGGDEDGATVAHENMPPVYGIWFIKRTARKFYRR